MPTPLLEQYRSWLTAEFTEVMVELAGRRQPDHAETARSDMREWCRDNRTLNPKGGVQARPSVQDALFAGKKTPCLQGA